MYLVDRRKRYAYSSAMTTAEPTIRPMTALIVDGLTLSATADDLRRMFRTFGSVVSCRIVLDHFGNSLRYGYVIMDSEDHADNAVKALNGKASIGLPITVAHVATFPAVTSSTKL